MASDKPDILLMGPPKPVIVNGLAPLFNVHRLAEAKDRDALIGGTRRRDARLVPGVPGFRAPPIPPRPSDSARSCDGAEVSSRALARMRLAGTLITWN